MKNLGLSALIVTVCGCGVEPIETRSNQDPLQTMGTQADSVLGKAPDRLRDILHAELRRDSQQIKLSDVRSRNVTVRRAAARALSRIADDRSVELLYSALADPDSEGATWAAYGLGYACAGHETRTVPALIERLESLGGSRSDPKPTALLDPATAAAESLGRCGTPEAERALGQALEAKGKLAEAAGLALGILASKNGTLEDETLTRLLDAAERSPRGVDSALFAFSRVGAVVPALVPRLLQVARNQAFGNLGLPRALSVRALSRAGDGAVKPLGRILVSKDHTPSERADAARGLARLGASGRQTLLGVIERLVPPARGAQKFLLSAEYGVLVNALLLVEGDPGVARPALIQLSELAWEADDEPAVTRRKATLRCRAADLLAGDHSDDPALRECDATPHGEYAERAQIAVLGRGKIEGRAARHWARLAHAQNVRVREAALHLIEGHPELTGAAHALTDALSARGPGLVATAAEVILAAPDRVRESATGQVLPEVVRALRHALHGVANSDVETRAALVDAVATLGLSQFVSTIELDCVSDNPTRRDHAQAALRKLGQPERTCARNQPGALPDELEHPVLRPVRLAFETDAGTYGLTLDPAVAPIAVARMVDLARSGFYEGVVVHRVVPGFVVQFGDPWGDGYGGVERPPLRCETSPMAYDTGSVGVPLAGRDTGSSQLFVTLGRFPHLDGNYALIGHADPGWERLAEGDIIQQVHAVSGDP